LEADLDGVKRLSSDKRDEATYASAEKRVQSRDNVPSRILMDLELLRSELVHGVVVGLEVKMDGGKR
jgi:hypothetical protein